MKKLLFLDTETTGNTEADFLCQVAYQVDDEEIKEELFKPEIPISVESSSVCHITNRMVAEKPAFKGSDFAENLKNDLAESIFVAHNAIFDITMLKKEDIEIDDDTVSLEFLTKIIQELPDRYRLVFNLYTIDGYSHKEIAQMLEISEGTSKSNLARAKMILKEKIKQSSTIFSKIK